MKRQRPSRVRSGLAGRVTQPQELIDVHQAEHAARQAGDSGCIASRGERRAASPFRRWSRAGRVCPWSGRSVRRQRIRSSRTRLPAAIMQRQRSGRLHAPAQESRACDLPETSGHQRVVRAPAAGAAATVRAGGLRREHAERLDPVRAGASLWEGWPRARRSATSSSPAGPARGSRAGRGGGHRRRCLLLATAEHVGKAARSRGVYLLRG